MASLEQPEEPIGHARGLLGSRVAKRAQQGERLAEAGFVVIILDDIGNVQQSRDEMDVRFTFLAERYERKSVMTTSNLVVSEWGHIFKDPMTRGPRRGERPFAR